VPWEKDHAEFKSFKSMDEWIRLAGEFGFKDSGKRLFQDKDPSDNALVRLIKQ
jgi:hypothetical protein